MVGRIGEQIPIRNAGYFRCKPNHFHGIIFIHEIVGADLRVGLDMDVGPSERGEHTGSPLPNNDGVDKHGMGEHILKDRGQAGAPLRIGGKDVPLSQIVQWFKTMTTNEYIRGVKQFHWTPFPGKLWQRNYYEHIIRNQQDYERIANYIVVNPAN